MAFSGVGTKLERSDDGGTTWTEIGEVKTIKGPSMSRETLDSTSLATTGGYRTFITGFRDGGTLTFTVNFTNAGYSAMKADFESDTEVQYRVTLSDSGPTVISFNGLVTECPITIPEGIVTFDTTIKISGEVTVA